MPNLTGAREARLELIRRTGHNLTLADLAEKLGRDDHGDLLWSKSHLTSVENGNRPASEELIALLAFHLQVTRQQLITGTVPDEPPKQPKNEPKGPARRQDTEKKTGPTPKRLAA